MLSVLFACIDVGNMHFDKGQGRGSQGITQGYRGMAVSSGIDDDRIHSVGCIKSGLLDDLDYFSLMIALLAN